MLRAGIRVAVVLLIFVLSACAATPVNPPARRAQALPSYEQLVARHNRNVESISRFWSFAVVEMTWREEGRCRFQQGEGQLAVVVPDRMSLTVGKAGHDVLRVGCNDTQYWLFDMSGEEKVMHLGRHAKVSESVEGAPGMPMQPRDLIRLLGVIKIDPAVGDTSPAVERINGDYLIEPPDSNCRMLLDPKTARPTRIDLLDEQRFSRVTAHHDRFAHVKTNGVSPGCWPFVPTLISITDSQNRGQIKLSLSDTVGNPEAINPRWFDPAVLATALQPDVVIDIDERRKLSSGSASP